jgi:hypothetical protein
LYRGKRKNENCEMNVFWYLPELDMSTIYRQLKTWLRTQMA